MDSSNNTKKKNNKETAKTRQFDDESDVPDSEGFKNSQTKRSMDQMIVDSIDEDKTPAPLALVNHEGGWTFADATAGEGVQGERWWLARRVAKDIGNCGATEANVHATSDHSSSKHDAFSGHNIGAQLSYAPAMLAKCTTIRGREI